MVDFGPADPALFDKFRKKNSPVPKTAEQETVSENPKNSGEPRSGNGEEDVFFGPADPALFDKYRSSRKEGVLAQDLKPVLEDSEPKESVPEETERTDLGENERFWSREGLAAAFERITGLQNYLEDMIGGGDPGLYDQAKTDLDAEMEKWPKRDAVGEDLEEFFGDLDNQIFAEAARLSAMKRDKDERAAPAAGGEEGDKDRAGDNLSERLEEARKKYLAAEKKLNQTGYTREILQEVLNSKSRAKLEAERKLAQKEYQEIRAEYTGANIEKFVAEQEQLLAGRFQAQEQIRAVDQKKWLTGLGKRYYEWHKGLGAINLEKPLGRFGMGRIGRAINARTGLSLLLLGGGIWLGAGTAVGLSAFALRRGLAGAGAGIGAYDLSQLAARSLERRRVGQDLKKGKDGVHHFNEYLAGMESRAILDGRTMEDLKKDELYRDLLGRRLKLVEDESRKIEERISKNYEGWGEELVPERHAQQLRDYLQLQSKMIDWEFKNKRWDVRFMTGLRQVFAGAVGAAIGTGVASVVVKEFFGGSQTPGALREIQPDPSPTVVSDTLSPKTFPPGGSMNMGEMAAKQGGGGGEVADAVAAAKSEGTLVQAGGRGLEGSLLDLKQTQPDQYAKMMKWLSDNYSSKTPGGNTPDKLVHRFVLDHAAEHDVASADMDQILQGGVRISDSGALQIEDVKFVRPEAAAPVPDLDISEAADSAQEAPASISEPAPPPAPEIPKIEAVPEAESQVRAGGITEAPAEAAGEAVAAETAAAASDESPAFLKFLELRSEDLAAVENKSVAEFRKDFFAAPNDYKQRYKGLARTVEILVSKGSWDEGAQRGKKVSEVLEYLAKIYSDKL